MGQVGPRAVGAGAKGGGGEVEARDRWRKGTKRRDPGGADGPLRSRTGSLGPRRRDAALGAPPLPSASPPPASQPRFPFPLDPLPPLDPLSTRTPTAPPTLSSPFLHIRSLRPARPPVSVLSFPALTSGSGARRTPPPFLPPLSPLSFSRNSGHMPFAHIITVLLPIFILCLCHPRRPPLTPLRFPPKRSPRVSIYRSTSSRRPPVHLALSSPFPFCSFFFFVHLSRLFSLPLRSFAQPRSAVPPPRHPPDAIPLLLFRAPSLPRGDGSRRLSGSTSCSTSFGCSAFPICLAVATARPPRSSSTARGHSHRRDGTRARFGPRSRSFSTLDPLSSFFLSLSFSCRFVVLLQVRPPAHRSHRCARTKGAHVDLDLPLAALPRQVGRSRPEPLAGLASPNAAGLLAFPFDQLSRALRAPSSRPLNRPRALPRPPSWPLRSPPREAAPNHHLPLLASFPTSFPTERWR